MSTVFHPQTDSTTEQETCSMKQVLRTMIDNDQENWVKKCPMAEFALFEINYGFML